MKKLKDILNKIAKGREDPDIDTPPGSCVTFEFDYHNCEWNVISCREVDNRGQCNEGLDNQRFTKFEICSCDRVNDGSCLIRPWNLPVGPEGEEEEGLCCLIITTPGGSTYKLCRGRTTRCGCRKSSRNYSGIGRVNWLFHEGVPGGACESINCNSTLGACCREDENGKCYCQEQEDAWQCLEAPLNTTGPGIWYPNRSCKRIERKNCCYPVT